jgi:hypothetical protein
VRPMFRTGMVLAAALLASTTAQAQPSRDSNAAASNVARCVETEPNGFNDEQVTLLRRAAKDPIIGCAVMKATHRSGDFTVAARDTVRGNLVVVDGTLRVSGTVTGSAIALNGAVLIDSGAHIVGDVISAEHGAAIAPAGRVDGELRTLDAIEPVTARTAAQSLGTFTSLKHTTVWFGVLLVLGIGVLINSGDSMQRVTAALHSGFGRNVTVGLLAQLAVIPVLVTICLLLTLTLIGILLVPFAAVAYGIALLGLLVLGGLGAAQMVGSGTLARRAGMTERGAHLQSLFTGMVLLAIPWFIAAASTSIPMLSASMRALAIGLTWVALTAGLGAALRTRGGTRSHEEPWGVRRPTPSGKPAPAVAAPASEWLTPTPITGVVAARRPTTRSGGGAR